MKYLLALALATTALATPAIAQKAILTGGQNGAYNSTFCPPIPKALDGAFFQGYQCTPTGGTIDNIKGVLASPSNIGFVQLDVYAREVAQHPELAKQTTVIRQDITCEGLWMVTKNPRLKTYGDVLGFARRIPFILPAQGSGSAASFTFLKSIDPDGLGRGENVKYLQDATAVINTVAAATDNSVGFFVQFADPENANIKLMQEKGLTVIPVVSREIRDAKVGDQALYQIQSFSLKAGGLFVNGIDTVTACTPVAVITGNPETAKDRNAKDNQVDLISAVREVPAAKLLPQDSRIAKLMQGMKRLGSAAVDEMVAAVEKAKQAAQ